MTIEDLISKIDCSYLIKISCTTLDDYDDNFEPLEFNGYETDLPNVFKNKEIYNINKIDVKNGYIDVTLE